MNVIKAKAIANRFLEEEIESHQGSAWRSTFKRQARRQVRHRLNAKMLKDLHVDVAEAIEMMSANSPTTISTATATIIAFPTRAELASRQIPVIRKLPLQPFQRQQYEQSLIAA